MQRSRQVARLALCVATTFGALVRAPDPATAQFIDPPATGGCARVVYYVESGVPTATCTIPGGSLLATHRNSGDSTPPCFENVVKFDPITHAPITDPATGLLTHISTPGQWVFRDVTTDTLAFVDKYGPTGTLYLLRFVLDPIVWDYSPLTATTRLFTVSCNIAGIGLFYQSDLYVPISDPFYAVGIEQAAIELRSQLPLPHAIVVADPSVKAVGGLVTRHPTWLAVDPTTWTPASVSRSVRGVTVTLAAFPIRLTFDVNATNNEGAGSTKATIDCAPYSGLVADKVRYPAIDPNRPLWSDPGPQGPCLWTPAWRGSVTITPVIDYRIDLLVGNAGRREPDLRRPGTPVTYDTGSISVVNVNNP